MCFSLDGLRRVRPILCRTCFIRDWRRALRVGLAISLFCAKLAAAEPNYDWAFARQLHAGIRYARLETESPRRMVISAVHVDTRYPGLQLVTTSRCDGWTEGEAETLRQTTRAFLRGFHRNDVQVPDTERPQILVAINADAFSPWPAPYQEEAPTNLNGLAVSQGVLISRGSGTPSLIVRKNGDLEIRTTHAETDISEVETAVSGFEMCLVEGELPPLTPELNPRTGLGLSLDRRYLVALTIDGRQPASEGASRQELGQWLRHFGAYNGINMDGGGSTTMAHWDVTLPDEDKSRLLNRPVGDGQQFDRDAADGEFTSTERANGNHLGIGVR
ncbi:MAG: phosphodiester glycosidase family protein [Planctomycetota bacterium]|nr:phosphodiester glycosidase family protein [Planctomycetota bacterium]